MCPLAQSHTRSGLPAYNLMICGCRSNCRYWISLSTRPAMSLLISFRRLMIFIATSCPVTLCCANLTLPKEPSPNVLTSRYWLRRLFERIVPGDWLYCNWFDARIGGETIGGRDGRPLGASYAGREMESSSSSMAEDMLASVISTGGLNILAMYACDIGSLSFCTVRVAKGIGLEYSYVV